MMYATGEAAQRRGMTVRRCTKPVRTARVSRVASALAATGLLGVTLLVSLAPPAGASSGSDSMTQARKDLLVLSDMPAGWTSTKNPNNSNSTLGDKQLASCIGVSMSLVSENPPSVNSRQFQNKQGTLTVADNVTVFPSAKNAAAEYAIGDNPKMPGCMTAVASGPLKGKLIGKTPKGTTYGNPLVSPVDPSAFGAGVDGYAMSVPVTSQGVTLNVNVTELQTVKGRLGNQVTFTAIGAPFSIPMEKQIMSVAAGRL
jgi:hypothetical protein